MADSDVLAGGPPAAGASARRWRGCLWVGLGMLGVALAVYSCGSGSSKPSGGVSDGGFAPPPSPPPPPTVQEFIQTEVAALNAAIPTSPRLKQLVEDIHPPAKYTGAVVRSVRAVTVDGSQSAGYGGSNVSELTIHLVLQWQGPITRDGFTELMLVYNVPARRMVEVKYLRSNARYNLATVDWFKVGLVIGAMLL